MSDSKGAAIDEILKRLLADVDDSMEFVGTMWRSKENASQRVRDDLEEAKEAILAILAQEVNKARIDELNLLIKDAAPLIPKESWQDWSWRVQKYLKDRLERLG